MVSWQAFGEAFALCKGTSLTPEQLVSLFTDISATTNAIKARAPMIAAMLAGGGDAAGATFTVDSGLKDLRTMAAEGKAQRDGPAAGRARRRLLRGSEPKRAGARATAPRSRSSGRRKKE